MYQLLLVSVLLVLIINAIYMNIPRVLFKEKILRKISVLFSVAGLVGASLFLNGCLSVGPDYEKPELTVVDSWGEAVTNSFLSGTNNISEWWTAFNDDILDKLILSAATNSPDLKIAAERINEAAALRGVAKSFWYPDISGDGTISRLQASEKAYSTLPPGKNKATYYSIGGSMAWELDLWGRVRRLVEASDASVQASIEDYRDVMVMLYGEIAYQYIQVRTLQNRIELTKESISLQKETLQVTIDRNNAGLAPDLDLYQAKMNLAQSQATIPPLRMALAKSIHRLSVLAGQTPTALMDLMNIDSSKIPVPPASITVGLPADLLRQRPDIRSAERRLASQTAMIGAKKAELYPAFSLPGMLKLEAYDAGDLGGDALSYGFGPAFRWNLFNGGRIRSQIKAEESKTRQAYINYQKVVLNALEDVENAMVSIKEERLRVASLRKAVAASSKSVELVKDLYKAGLTDFQNVLTTEQAYMKHQDDLAKAEGNIAGYTVQLYKALGGGWSVDSENDGAQQSDK